MMAKTLLGEPLLFGRGADGRVFALRDICPHRGIPLSFGRFDGREVECCYHGWRFDGAGRCTAIPSLVPEQEFDIGRIKVKSLSGAGAARKHLGLFRRRCQRRAAGPAAARYRRPRRRISTRACSFPCAIDHAVIGLMDPAHGPFVHRAWWWRSATSIHAKEKAFGPTPFGFAMLRHRAVEQFQRLSPARRRARDRDHLSAAERAHRAHPRRPPHAGQSHRGDAALRQREPRSITPSTGRCRG